MKRITTAAIALSLAATSAMAQDHDRRGGWRDRQDGAANTPQAQPQAQQPRPPQTQPAQAQPVQAQPERASPRFGGAIGREIQSRREAEARAQAQAQAPVQAAPPQPQQQQRPPRSEGPRASRPPAPQQQAAPVQAPRPDGRRDGDGRRDRDGWNRDGGQGGWSRDGRGPEVRPEWARPDGRRDRDRDRPRYDSRRYQQVWRAPQRFRVPYYVQPFGYYDRSWSYNDYLPWGWYGPNYWISDWYRFGLPPPPIGCEWVRVGRDALLIDTFDGRILSVARYLFW